VRIAHTVARNTGILVALEIVTRISGIVLTIAIARKLGAADFGLFTFAFSFGGLFGVLVTFGLDKLITREVARDHGRAASYLGRVLVVESSLSILAMALMLVILLALGYQLSRLLIVAMAGAIMLLDSLIRLIACFFRAYQRMEYEALVRSLLRVVNVLIGLAILYLGYGLVELIIAQIAVFALALSLSLFIVHRNITKPVFTLSWPLYRALLRAAAPFALSMAFITIYERTGTILLSFLKGDEVTGWYSGAGTFVRLFDFIPMSFMGALLPAMAQFQGSQPIWYDAYRRSMKYLLMIALPIAIGLAMRSSQFVKLLLGEQYGPSASILTIIIWVLVISFLNHGASNALISIDREKAYLAIVGFGAALNIAANWGLIPSLGPYGAAVAKLLTECVVLASQFYVLTMAKRKVQLKRIVAKPLASGLILASALYLIRGMGLWLAVSIGIVVYIAALFLLRIFDRDEILLMTELIRSGLSKFGFRRSAI